ncbi:hypothetical protein [Leucobacter sp. GX24907]
MFLIFVQLLRPMVTGPDRGVRRERRRGVRCMVACSAGVPDPSIDPLSALPVMAPPFAAAGVLGGFVAPPFAVDWLFEAAGAGADSPLVDFFVAMGFFAAGAFAAGAFVAETLVAAGFLAAGFFAAGFLAADFFVRGASAAFVASAAEVSGVCGDTSRAIAFPSIEDGCMHPYTGIVMWPKRDPNDTVEASATVKDIHLVRAIAARR